MWQITLSGVPLGGTIRGTGTLRSATGVEGGVVLEEQFERALSRRLVGVQSARTTRNGNHNRVRVRRSSGACR